MRHYDLLPSVEGRPVIKCDACRLVQFRPDSGSCRKCKAELETGPVMPIAEPEKLVDVPDWAPALYGYDFPFALSYCRLKRGKSQKQLAIKLGIPRTGVSRIERGCQGLRLETAERHVAALGYSMAEFTSIAQILGGGA